MPGMPMPGPSGDAPMSQSAPLIHAELSHDSSGTSIEPLSTPMPMLMSDRLYAGWTLMLHGIAFVSDVQQHAITQPTAPPANVCLQLDALCAAGARRGGDKLFSTNWVMPMAQRRVGHGEVTLRAMLSLEPATITAREYPELFQQGETAFGKPIVDGQHPHDFVMELAALYDLHVSDRTLLSFYAAPVGDPAIGPTAYPHRLSASEDPLAALGHHQQDSTHIAFNVLTLGVTRGAFRLEASGFHGAEPTEARWSLQPSPNGLAIDSLAGRLTWAPIANLSAQYSLAHIVSPEALNLGQNQRRQTASLMYNRPLGAHHDTTSMPGMDMATPANGNWANTLVWGQTRNLTTGLIENSYLAESLVNFDRRNYAWTRIEAAARTSELLDLPSLSPGDGPPAEVAVGHVQAYSFGYDRDLGRDARVLLAPGAQFTVYRAPNDLASSYGRHPVSVVVFIRLRIHSPLIKAHE
jgi:hypothetical protein